MRVAVKLYLLLVLAVYVVLVLASFVFSLAETAYGTLRPILIRIQAARGDKDAQRVLKIVQDLQKTINAIIIGDNVLNMTFTTILTFTGFALDGVTGAVAFFLVNLFVVFVFGEAWPKQLAVNNPEKVALHLSRFIMGYVEVMEGPSVYLSVVGRGISRLAGIRNSNRGDLGTEERIIHALELGKLEGVISDKQHEFINRMLRIDDILASSIMVARNETVVIASSATVEEALKLFGKAGHRRLPVVQLDPLCGEKPIGALHIKDVTVAYVNGYSAVSVSEICDQIVYVAEDDNLVDVFSKMQKAGVQVAAVSRDGCPVGYVFMSDVLEEVVGLAAASSTHSKKLLRNPRRSPEDGV
jgi:putative hemolysin